MRESDHRSATNQPRWCSGACRMSLCTRAATTPHLSVRPCMVVLGILTQRPSGEPQLPARMRLCPGPRCEDLTAPNTHITWGHTSMVRSSHSVRASRDRRWGSDRTRVQGTMQQVVEFRSDAWTSSSGSHAATWASPSAAAVDRPSRLGTPQTLAREFKLGETLEPPARKTTVNMKQ